MSKLTIPERAQLKEVCKETLIRKLTQKEAHIYVNSKLQGFNISFDYVQKVRNQISKNTKEELLHLEKDQYALIQSLFFDRKDELEHIQKVCWSIIEKNQSNADIQIKTIEQLHIISDKLTHLYHSLPYHVEFGARRHFYIDKEVDGGAILTPEQQRYLDNIREGVDRMQYEKDFAEMKKKHPTMSDDEIDSLIEEQEQKEEEEIQKA
jgi:hypothetical protein